MLGKKDYVTLRNEYYKDTDGERTGYPSVYTCNAVGLTHEFTPLVEIRPELDYFRSWTNPAFDNGTRKNQFMAAFDFTVRF